MSGFYKMDKRKPIDHETLATKATAVLRNMIITGECPQGAKITEVSLAEAIGVSRACIREAFISLEKEGLLIKVQNHYTQVIQFSPKDAEDICELRIAVETMALRHCIDNKTLDLEKLGKKADALIDYNTQITDENVIDWLEEDMSFHHDLVRGSENMRALKVWEGWSNQVVAMLYMAHRINPNLISPSDNHRDIVKAIRLADFEEGARLIQSHIQNSIESIKRAIAIQDTRANRPAKP